MMRQLSHTLGKAFGVALWPLKTFWQEWQWFYRSRLTRALLVVVLLLEVWRAFIEDRWPGLDALRHATFWLLGNTVFQAILIPLSLLAVYGLIYWLHIRNGRYIVVAEFRAWGKLAEKFTDKGLAARLRDELMRLWQEMRAQKLGPLPETARATAYSRTALDFSAKKPPRFLAKLAKGLSLPEAHVTLQYEGISVEAVHTFIRRIGKREVVITADLMEDSGELVLAARTATNGPWEVRVKNSDSLELGLRRLSLRIMTTLAQEFLPKNANIFVFLHYKARDLKEDELVVRLADLGLEATPHRLKEYAKKNIAKAYNERGIWLAKKECHLDAIVEFERAIKLFPDYALAYRNLARAHNATGNKEKADAAFKKAKEVEKRLKASALDRSLTG